MITETKILLNEEGAEHLHQNDIEEDIELVNPTRSCPNCHTLLHVPDPDAGDMGRDFGRWLWKFCHATFLDGLKFYLNLSEEERIAFEQAEVEAAAQRVVQLIREGPDEFGPGPADGDGMF